MPPKANAPKTKYHTLTPAEINAYYRWIWETSRVPENKNGNKKRNSKVKQSTYNAFKKNKALLTVKNSYAANASSSNCF